MNNDYRQFNLIYAVPVLVKANTVVNSSTKLFFTPVPFLLDKKVKAISIYFRNSVLWSRSPYLTLFNGKNQQVFTNHPSLDFWNNQNAGGSFGNFPYRLRLTDIDGINTQSSYLTTSDPTPLTYTVDTIFGYINFYQ
jgi:hypothetical protein